jgi:hypothetical protein
MDDIEREACRAARCDDRLDELAKRARERWWPTWSDRSVKQRICHQLDPHNEENPLQARLLVEVLRDTGDEDLFDLLTDAYREGRARKAERDRDRALRELDMERRRMRVTRPARAQEKAS